MPTSKRALITENKQTETLTTLSPVSVRMAMPVKHDLIGKGRKESKEKAKRPEVNVTVSSSRLLRRACVALRMAYYNVLLEASLYHWSSSFLVTVTISRTLTVTTPTWHNGWHKVTAQQVCVCYFYLEYRYNDGLG